MGTSPASGACSCGPGRTCDGLECLCRPRYFAGQLLTDEDLRRLDHYIVAKNRLHNRYLHGTGVVCGLEVVCNPCDPTVTVRTGFALGRRMEAGRLSTVRRRVNVGFSPFVTRSGPLVG